MKFADIKKMDEATLRQKIKEAGKELVTLRLQSGTSGLEKPHLVKLHQKVIARSLTAINQKGK